MRHSISRRGCLGDSKCCLKTADLSQHSSDCLQDTSVPRHARLSRDISGSARAMACVETGRLRTAPCVARREVQNRRRLNFNSTTPAQGTVQSFHPRDGCCWRPFVNRRRSCTRREGHQEQLPLKTCVSTRALQRLRNSPTSLQHASCACASVCVCAVPPGRARQV